MKAPTIIIGVGGVGSQICAKVEKQFLHAVRQSGDEDSSDNIRFIAIDTDINSLGELHRHGFQGKRILLTDNMTVAKCCDIIGDSSINCWYPENSIFSKKSMTEGAGQQRSISRLAFEYCIRDGRLDQLGNTVRDLNRLKKKESRQRTRFYIISSLAGGTGSGIILPLAMYINDLVLKMYGDYLAICKGFFILSSAFYAQNRMSALERKSLDANAYAAVKELSAFMRATDKSKAKREGESSYSFAKKNPEAPSYLLANEDLRGGASYEYCYLFGLTNERNKGIHSFEELKEVVADAVYMQACSPMQDRNNSREDNSLRHVDMLGQTNQEDWMRRFGGIGCGRLVYPYEDLVRYFGLLWAKDTMGRTWRKYDEEYYKSRRSMKDRQFGIQGITGPSQGEAYIRAVNDAGSSDLLAGHICRECTEAGTSKTPWDLYLEALNAEAHSEITALWQQYTQSNIWSNFQTKLQDLTNRISTKDANDNRYQAAEQVSILWDKIWDEMVERLDLVCDSVCGNLFRLHSWDPAQGRNNLRKCWLEYWLISDQSQFMHPNSLRYFLYHLKNAAAQSRRPPVSMAKPNSPFQTQKKPRMSLSKGEDLKRKFEAQRQQLSGFMADMLWECVLNRCESYVKKLIDCYEDFYSGYDMILEEFDADISTIRKKLDRKDGVIHYYVCSDKTCRDKLLDELRLRRGYDVGAVSGVSYELFRLVHESGLTSGRMATRECANRIKDFWCTGIERKDLGGDLLDMNILRAMNTEAKLKAGRPLTEADFEEEICRVEDSLVAPFIQFFRRLDMNTGISLCCYHSSLKDEIGTFRNMVNWLDDHDAVDDPDYCSKRELLFYRSFVGLEPYEILDYLHGISAQTAVEGQAFRSYREMLNDMGKNGKTEGKIMTPHADVKWHNLYYMGDPSSHYQQEQELLVAIALLFSCLNGAVRVSGGEKNYSFIPPGTNSDSDDVTFDHLLDLHTLLYGNIYWYMGLCRDMYRSVWTALDQKEDAYQAILKNTNRSPFDVIILYQNELSYGSRTGKQRRLLADACVCLVYVCMEKPFNRSRESACVEQVLTLLKAMHDTLAGGSVIGLNKETVVISPHLQAELKNFFESFAHELENMADNEIRRRYGMVMENNFARYSYET